MTAQVDYISQTKNRLVVKYTSGVTGGDVNFSVGPNVFGPTGGEFATRGLTYTSAALSRIYYAIGGTSGHVAINYVAGSGLETAWILPADSTGEINLERMTVPNSTTGGTGYAQFDNNLSAEKHAVILAEFVTQHK